MAAVWMRALHDLRRRWRGALILGLLLAIAAGVVMTAAASARRTTSAYERLLRDSDAFDVEVQITGEAEPSILEDVAKLPQVAEHGRIAFVPSTKASRDSATKPFRWDLTTAALVDANVGRTMEIPEVVSGRFPRADAPHEAFANESFARKQKLEVGDTFAIQLATFPELFELFGGGRPVATGPLVTLTIVGIGQVPHDVSISEPTGILILTPGFFRTYSDESAHLLGMFVRLKNGDADGPAFLDGAKDLARKVAGPAGAEEEVLGFRTNTQSRSGVDRALGVQSFAFWIFAAVVGAAMFLVLGQALGRWQTIAADDLVVLRALGMGRSQLTLASALPIVIVVVGAALLAVLVSLALSPLVPIGFARGVEPDIGFFADALVLTVGAAAIVVLVGGWACLRAVLFASRARREAIVETKRPSTAAEIAARSGLPAPVVAGVRFGLEPGRGRSAVPVRSVLAGTTLAILAVVGAFVFRGSLDHMLVTPSTYGWNFDLVAFGGEDPEIIQDLERKLSTSPSVGDFSRASIRTTTFKGRDMETLGVGPIKGSVLPVVLDGRFPRTAGEVALASRTLRESGVALGQRVSFPAPNDACPRPPCAASFVVVGKVIHWGEGSDSDDGAAFTEVGQARLRTSEGFIDYFVRLPSGADRDVALPAIEREFGETASPFSAEANEQSAILGSNLRNVDRVRSVPAILGAVLAALAFVTLVHALLMTARRRRYDLAILKTLGFERRQVTATVAWQATTLVVLALLVGTPLGIVAGRWAWSLLASRLGVVDAPSVAPLWILGGAVATLLLANVTALLPGRAAARTPAALVLRTE